MMMDVCRCSVHLLVEAFAYAFQKMIIWALQPISASKRRAANVESRAKKALHMHVATIVQG